VREGADRGKIIGSQINYTVQTGCILAIRTLRMSVLALKHMTLTAQKLNLKINVGQSTYITTQLLNTINTID
jgi:hypothetical protein